MRSAAKLLSQVGNSTLAVRLHGVEHQLQTLRLRLSDPSRITKNGQRLFEISDVIRNPESYRAASSVFSEREGLEVRWADGLTSRYSSDWLVKHLRTTGTGLPVRTRGRTETYLWSAQFVKLLPDIKYSDLTLESGKASLSSHLTRYGIALIRGVPCEQGQVVRVGNQIGYVRNTNYGELFDVIDLGSQGNNLAQTNSRIMAHTDNPYRDPFPGIQMLHCLQRASAGGATLFTDGFAVALQLREKDPAAFDILTRHPHPYEYCDPTQGVLLRAAAPVISLDSENNVIRICFNNRSAGVIDLPSSELEAYYRAWAEFDRMCNMPINVVRVPLSPGNLVIWDNSRVMHGREEYTAFSGRHIQGCYIDHDAIRSRADWANQATENTSAQTDVHRGATELAMQALATQAEFSYGEGVDMLQHALQAAALARENGETPEAILASLMHDVGNAPQARAAWEAAGNEPSQLLVSPSDNSIGYRHHALIGGCFLESLGFAPEVVGAVKLHVSAKRALVAMDPSYMDELSQASIDTLAQQGGPMSPEESAAFRAMPGSDTALRLRRYDDQGKFPEAAVPQLEQYRELIYDHLWENSSGIPSPQILRATE